MHQPTPTIRADVACPPLVGGLVVAVVAVTLVTSRGPALEALSPTVTMITYALVLGAAAAVLVHWRFGTVADGTDTWTHRLARRRHCLGACAAALIAAQAASQASGPAAAGAAIVANTLAALLLCMTALRLLRQAMQERQEEHVLLSSALRETEDAALELRELVHEMCSSLAGIASASEILRQSSPLPTTRRQRLERLREAEIARLMRLVDARRFSSESREMDVDEVLEPIVASHQVRGTDVRWNPGAPIAVGQADALAVVVNILLDNAARHGAGPVTLTTATSGDVVEIVCSDRGAGIPAALSQRVFQSGVRRAESPGQGLGLAIAQRLMTQQDGSLELREDVPGTTFVVRVPRQEVAHAVAHAS